MITSSAPQSYSTASTSDTTGSITISNNSYDTITLTDPISISTVDTSTLSTYTFSSGANTFTIGASGSSGSSYINSIDTTSIIFNTPEEWVDCFPDFDRIEQMCKEYPGLAIAFEKFKTTYKLVKDHYDTPEDQRPKP